jgi:hypothetical protein
VAMEMVEVVMGTVAMEMVEVVMGTVAMEMVEVVMGTVVMGTVEVVMGTVAMEMVEVVMGTVAMEMVEVVMETVGTVLIYQGRLMAEVKDSCPLEVEVVTEEVPKEDTRGFPQEVSQFHMRYLEHVKGRSLVKCMELLDNKTYLMWTRRQKMLILESTRHFCNVKICICKV